MMRKEKRYKPDFLLIPFSWRGLCSKNGKVVGLECFGYKQTFTKFFPKLGQSYALDALDWLEDARKTQVSAESVRHFLEAVQKAPGESHPSLGLAENV